MYKIFHHDCSHDMAQSGDPVLVRKPMDFSTGKESKTCKYAFFPDAGFAERNLKL